MDFNVMCKDPSFIGLCNYLANIYKLYKAINESGFTNPYNPSPSPNPNPNPQLPDWDKNACKPDRFSHLIGSTFDPKDDTFKLKNGSTETLQKNYMTSPFRIIGPTTATTKDLNYGRLNIYYDNDSKKSEDPGSVTKINCG